MGVPAVMGVTDLPVSRMEDRELIIDGLVGIARGDNPRSIETKLRGYLV